MSGDSPQLSRRESQKHDEVHRCCRHRARHVHDSRNYKPCSQDTGAYLRAAPCLMGRTQGRSLSSESFWEGSSNVLGEFREARSPATPSSPNERSLWRRISLEIHTQMCLVDESQVLLYTSSFFVFRGATFVCQRFVLELSQRWVEIVSYLH